MPAGDNVPVSGRFEFATAARIVFGAGTRAELPGLAAALGRKIFFVGGAQPQRHGALIDALRRAAESVTVFAVPGEPTVELAANGAALARAEGCDVVVAVGGGSAIDAAKAVAAFAVNVGDPLDHLEIVGRGLPLLHPALPLLAVPTTAGTGAEVTRNAVLGVPAAGRKVSLRSPHLLPRVALVDPELASGLPPSVTAASGMDALTQLIEPFLSCRSTPMTDALCRDGLPRAARALPQLLREPDNAAARADMALAALLSGLALANAGLGAVHGLAGVIGGRFPAPHGAVCAALLPPILQVNLAALRSRAAGSRALARLDELARLLTGRPGAVADDAVAHSAELAATLAIPPLRTWGMSHEDLPTIAAEAAASSSMKGNPVPLATGELTAALAAAL